MYILYYKVKVKLNCCSHNIDKLQFNTNTKLHMYVTVRKLSNVVLPKWEVSETLLHTCTVGLTFKTWCAGGGEG